MTEVLPPVPICIVEPVFPPLCPISIFDRVFPPIFIDPVVVSNKLTSDVGLIPLNTYIPLIIVLEFVLPLPKLTIVFCLPIFIVGFVVIVPIFTTVLP